MKTIIGYTMLSIPAVIGLWCMVHQAGWKVFLTFFGCLALVTVWILAAFLFIVWDAL